MAAIARAGGTSGGRFDEVLRSDVAVVGTGVAGLTAALGSAPRRVALLTKTTLGHGGASPWAQGGVAVAIGADDTPALHAADTLAAGAGLNDPEIVDLLAEEGPGRVRRLIELGTRFDRDAGGGLALGREAAHSRRRILHAKDATGAEIVRALAVAVAAAPEVEVHEGAFALDLAVQDGAVVGVAARHADGRRVLHLAPAVVLATGGLGRLYLHSTNPPEATGDGLAMAARAGARLVDLEFVQFHPTALAVPEAAGEPLPLLTEALRGEGAVLLDQHGRRFMPAEHPDAELAPRDVVARAIWRRLAAGDRVFLDATRAVGARFPERFPTVFALCRERGLDPRVEAIPVAPAAHYQMGGVEVDAAGRTSLPGLWACGEVASTGAHGANRLASNSLLEALVFGARVAEDLRKARPRGTPLARVASEGSPRHPEGSEPEGTESDPGPAFSLPGEGVPPPGRGRVGEGGGQVGAGPLNESDRVGAAAGPAAYAGDPDLELTVRRLMWERVGLVRDAVGLTAAVADLDRLASGNPGAPREDTEPTEAANLLLAGRLVARAALARRESRGGHYRSDFPQTDPAWRRRLALTLEPGGEIRLESEEIEPAALAAVR
jgi:L-aspartate oxidase